MEGGHKSLSSDNGPNPSELRELLHSRLQQGKDVEDSISSLLQRDVDSFSALRHDMDQDRMWKVMQKQRTVILQQIDAIKQLMSLVQNLRGENEILFQRLAVKGNSGTDVGEVKRTRGGQKDLERNEGLGKGTNRPSTHVGANGPSTHVETNRPSTHVGTNRPSTHVGANGPSTHVGTNRPSTHVGANGPSTHVDVLKLDRRDEILNILDSLNNNVLSMKRGAGEHGEIQPRESPTRPSKVVADALSSRGQQQDNGERLEQASREGPRDRIEAVRGRMLAAEAAIKMLRQHVSAERSENMTPRSLSIAISENSQRGEEDFYPF